MTSPRLRRKQVPAYLAEKHGIPIAVATLNKLAVAVTRRHEAFSDPRLQDVLDQIELRAHVELAKLEALDKRIV